MRTYGNAISIRGDSLYCPLPLSLDAYWNCLVNCHHCYLRKLNHTWGKDLRPADPIAVKKKLINGLKNKNPKTPLAHALQLKKTIRLGNKTDPFQPAERKYRITRKLIRILIKLEWTFVIQTRCTKMMMKYLPLLIEANKKNLVTIMPVISPGLEKDWEILERKRTTHPIDRLKHSRILMDKGIPVGINGEPFIPGLHTIRDFKETIKLLKKWKIKSYNTYNFHFNDYVAKRLHAIDIDIEKIWYGNQDKAWKVTLQKLLKIAEDSGIRLGCPDFVNTGMKWKEKANTCCGINVPNPCTFNTHYFKYDLQKGYKPSEIIFRNYDGTGDYDDAIKIAYGKECDFYTLKDIIGD